MISLVRYLVSILVNLVMLAIGGFLCYAGATSLITVFTLQAAFSVRPVESGPSVGESLMGTSDFAELWLKDLTPWAITFGYLLVGLPLLVFAARGILRRVRGGLPAEDEGTARTWGGRSGQLLLYGAALLFGLATIVIELAGLAGPALLTATGEPVMARIERTWNATQTPDKSDSGYFLAYVFTTLDGATIRETTPASPGALAGLEPGDAMLVLYDPGDPAFHVLPDLYSAEVLITFFGFRLFLVGFGIWGIRRAVRLAEVIEEPALRRPAGRAGTATVRRRRSIGAAQPRPSLR